MKNSTPKEVTKPPARDPRFPDYSKVTGNGFANDREVQDSQRGGSK